MKFRANGHQAREVSALIWAIEHGEGDASLEGLGLSDEGWARLVHWSVDAESDPWRGGSGVLPELAYTGTLSALREKLPDDRSKSDLYELDRHWRALLDAQLEAAFAIGAAHGRRTAATEQVNEAQFQLFVDLSTACDEIEDVGMMGLAVGEAPKFSSAKTGRALKRLSTMALDVAEKLRPYVKRLDSRAASKPAEPAA